MSCILKYITEIVDCISILLLNNLTVPGLQQGRNWQKCTILAERWGGQPNWVSALSWIWQHILHSQETDIVTDIHPAENNRALEFGCLKKKKKLNYNAQQITDGFMHVNQCDNMFWGRKKQIAALEQVISVCVPWWSGVWQLWKMFGFGNEEHHPMSCCQPRFPGAFCIYFAYSPSYRGVIFFLGGPFTHTVCLEISKILLGKRISAIIFCQPVKKHVLVVSFGILSEEKWSSLHGRNKMTSFQAFLVCVLHCRVMSTIGWGHLRSDEHVEHMGIVFCTIAKHFSRFSSDATCKPS